MADDDIFFTQIQQPKQFRKGLLESSKDVITILRDYQTLLEMRDDKKQKIEHLQQQFNELNGLMEDLNNFLPEESMHKLEELMPEREEEPEEEPDHSEEEGREEEVPEEGEEEGQDEGEVHEEHEPEEEPDHSEEESEIARLNETLQAIDEKLQGL